MATKNSTGYIRFIAALIMIATVFLYVSKEDYNEEMGRYCEDLAAQNWKEDNCKVDYE